VELLLQLLHAGGMLLLHLLHLRCGLLLHLLHLLQDLTRTGGSIRRVLGEGGMGSGWGWAPLVGLFLFYLLQDPAVLCCVCP
jgi:hypothetical protein